MNEPGVCTLWIRTPEPEPVYLRVAEATESQERHLVILKINTESVAMQLVFRRTDFVKMMAKPDEGDPFEVAVVLEEE